MLAHVASRSWPGDESRRLVDRHSARCGRQRVRQRIVIRINREGGVVVCLPYEPRCYRVGKKHRWPVSRLGLDNNRVGLGGGPALAVVDIQCHIVLPNHWHVRKGDDEAVGLVGGFGVPPQNLPNVVDR